MKTGTARRVAGGIIASASIVALSVLGLTAPAIAAPDSANPTATVTTPATATATTTATTTATATTGTLTLLNPQAKAGDDLTFSYSTDRPVALNWVGLYNSPADGPTDQSYHSPSTAYTYTGANTSGTVTVSGANLTSGHDITAYFLYNDGYTWLAQPVTFRVTDPAPYTPTPTSNHLVTSTVIQAPTPPNSSIRVEVGGLWFGASGSEPSSPATFTKTGGSAWLTISPDGTVSGTSPAKPASSGGMGSISVAARDALGAAGTLTIEFPLSAAGTAPSLKTATLSMWDAGSHVDGAEEKLVASILLNRLDVVGLQETGGTEAAAVAEHLGWSHVESSNGQAIISRYPLAPGTVALPAGLPAVTAIANVGGRSVRLWSSALDPAAFGPDAACSSGSAAAVAAEKTTLRYQQAVTLASAVSARRTATVPVIVMADLESPSSSDWTTSTSSQHCRAGSTAWPVPAALTSAGLRDSYRYVHPNPALFPGQTTSIFTSAPVAPNASTDGPERIDYIDFSGHLTVTESHTLVDGFPKGPTGSNANAWISDRAAVVTTFLVTSTTP